MLVEGGTPLSTLQAAVRGFQAREERRVDLKSLRVVIDALECEFAAEARDAKKSGDHLIGGNVTAASWISRICGMSVPSAADRVCVGEKREHLDEEQWIGFARENSVKELRWLSDNTRYALDPDGFERDTEESYEERFLHISEMNGMYHLSGVIDPEGGAALKTAVDALAKRLGQEDGRTPKQRRADALTEIVYHAMDEGRLPRRNGVRPHVAVTTTVEGLKAELGAAAAELEPGMPISSKTVQRLACDGTLCRVLKADSMVVDVGQPLHGLARDRHPRLQLRGRGCCGPGCDRPMNWTTPHHIEFWAEGGPSNLPNLLPLCYYHHRLVHEGGWQVIKVGHEFRFVPPDRVVMRRARWPGMRWAA